MNRCYPINRRIFRRGSVVETIDSNWCAGHDYRCAFSARALRTTRRRRRQRRQWLLRSPSVRPPSPPLSLTLSLSFTHSWANKPPNAVVVTATMRGKRQGRGKWKMTWRRGSPEVWFSAVARALSCCNVQVFLRRFLVLQMNGGGGTGWTCRVRSPRDRTREGHRTDRGRGKKQDRNICKPIAGVVSKGLLVFTEVNMRVLHVVGRTVASGRVTHTHCRQWHVEAIISGRSPVAEKKSNDTRVLQIFWY